MAAKTGSGVHASEFSLEKNSFCYLEGDDVYWRRVVVDKFIRAVPEEYRDFNLKRLPSGWTSGDLSEAVSAISPFFDQPIVVICGSISSDGKKKDTKPSKKEGKEETVSKADTENWNAIISAAGAVDAVKVLILDGKIPSTFKKQMTAVDCSKPDAAVLRKLIEKLASPYKIDFRASNALAERTDGNAERIANELEKLKSFCDGKAIAYDDVTELVADTMERSVFELTNALADKDKARAKALLDRFISSGVAYPQLFRLLISQYRRLFYAAVSPLGDKELAETMGVKEYAVTKNRAAAKKYGKQTLKKVLDLLERAEFDYRSGVDSDETAFNSAFADILTI